MLLHGFGDTPQTLTYLARRINEAGFRVYAPLYPGHGTTPQDFFRSTAEQWIDSARVAMEKLRKRSSSISLVGLSMGAAIASILAAEDGEITSVTLLAPYMRIPVWVRLALSIRAVWAPFVGTIASRHPLSIRDPEERAKGLGYGVVNAAAMSQLSRVVRMGLASLPRVMSPTLVIQSRKDPRISVRTASGVLKQLGAKEKQLVLTESGGHVITVDYGREEVFAATIGWISKWSNQPPR